jgi:isoleucyl-tRNA synthetase
VTLTEPGSYKDTVNLPQTKFDMRANAVKREPELQQFWAEHQIYEKLSDQNPGELFILHDGPPYANGELHMGHALNKVLKDIVNKYQMLKGRKVRYVPGWDCHGLPIELKVLQAMKAEERQKLTPIELRHRAKAWALGQQQQQCEGFERLGIWGDWQHPYLTMQPEYEAAQIHVFGQMVLKGYIYRGVKPVYWSPSSRTALAEAELEYPEGHTSPSVYAAFKMLSLSAPVLQPYLENLGVAIWTTTPWTLPANLAVAVNPELKYSVVEATGLPFQYLIVATDLVDRLAKLLETELTVKVTVTGKELEHSTYQHPLFERQSPIVIGGDYVTTESGTGLVHTAPGHGQDDFMVGQRYGLPVLSQVHHRSRTVCRIEGSRQQQDQRRQCCRDHCNAGGAIAAKTRGLRSQISLRLAHQKAGNLPRYRAVVRFGGRLSGCSASSHLGSTLDSGTGRKPDYLNGGGAIGLVYFAPAELGGANPSVL